VDNDDSRLTIESDPFLSAIFDPFDSLDSFGSFADLEVAGVLDDFELEVSSTAADSISVIKSLWEMSVWLLAHLVAKWSECLEK